MRLPSCAVLVLVCACSQETDAKGYDGDPKTVSATDQSNDPADIDVAARVRKTLVDANDLSVAAENVTVVANDGTVTLRGTVATADEMRRVESLVKGVTGVTRVDNQIVVKSE